MFGFEKLDVWHKAVNYAATIYQVTSTFPDEERFGLTNQLRRSAVSISFNIAEGSSGSLINSELSTAERNHEQHRRLR